jgi:sugar/nucleoside kinase (ribokinase family)
VPALPQHDQKVLGELIGKHPGGMGGNVACAASRLGLRTGMVSWVGDDADSQLVLADLQRFEVDISHITIVPNTSTNYTTILLDPSGEKAIIIVPTAFDTLVLDPTLTAYLQRARLVYCAAYDPEQLARVAQVVHAAGGLVSTDIEPVAGLQEDTLRHILSLVDLAFIDADALTVADYAQAAQGLQAGGPEIIIITLGAGGSLACNAQGVTRGQAFQAPVVDTTGAGDCFTAAFLAAYLRRQPLDQALRYASAAAALSIQGYGARGALPTAQQVQTFLHNYQESPH